MIQSDEFNRIVASSEESSVSGVISEVHPLLPFDYIDESRLGKSAIVVHKLMSDKECEEMVSFIDQLDRLPTEEEEITLTAASSSSSHRNNQRASISSSPLASSLLHRLTPVLQLLEEDSITCDAENKDSFLNNGFGMEGKWKLHHLNSCFRLCKYHPGGHFGPHYDSDYVVNPMRERSLKTFMIYLNDTYEGGQTNFVDGHDLHMDKAKGIYCAPPETIFASLKAKRGDCLLFDHKLLHEGQQVQSGEKYIIRSDLTYVNETEDSSDEHRRKEEAMRLYMEGSALEGGGDVNAAIAKYKKAFKLCPEIEEAYA